MTHPCSRLQRPRLQQLSLGYRIAVFAGFLVHIYIVTCDYFLFETMTEYSSESLRRSRSFEQLPSLSVCVPYTDILDYERLQQVMGESVCRSDQLVQRTLIHSRLTIRQVFDLTPSPQELMASCYFRVKDGFLLSWFPQSSCEDLLRVDRFFTQHSMCYVVRPNLSFQVSIENARISLSSPSVLYGFQLSRRFHLTNQFAVSVFYGELPYKSQRLAAMFDRMSDFQRQVVHFRAVMLSFFWTQKKLLPPPFDTRCHNVSRCLEECWSVIEDRVDRILYERFVTEESMQEQSKRRVVSFADLEQNASMRRQLEVLTDLCADTCVGSWCDYSHTVTQLDASRTVVWGNESLSLYVKSEKMPGVTAQSLPRVDPMAFLVYLSSCLEVWLGMHFSSTSSLALRLMRKLRKMRRRRRRQARRLRRPV